MVGSSDGIHEVKEVENPKLDVPLETSQTNKNNADQVNGATTDLVNGLGSLTLPASNTGDKYLAASNTGDKVLNSLLEQRLQIRKMKESRPLSRSELESKKIIHHEMANKEVINKFRNIRTKLFERDSQENSIVLVCSPKNGGGCSFFSTNLAAAISLEETKTALLVDCNLDNPTITRTFNYESEDGLTDYIEQPSLDFDKIILPSGISRFRVVPAGTQTEGSSEYFTSIRMRQFLQSTKARYPDRYIIIDAPPVLSSADTSILASMCDKVIIVIPYGKIQESDLDSAIEAVGLEKLTGVVFNENLY